ncbi:pentatricopeptide repeat-containing protein At1g66345, mitochondrial [Abrus precatorius]|uniref:Pentatricopeptide repeat-containing protein At1g66345, mitochondrial n=1 Tax=Abrus precatorius TaxID=3816 RepID=A0A8B8LL14_ABRPR|nr:pentatricopeptide repeat-containing protein At1g66345, mitochondrial [Abrus precatorius]
MGSKSFLRVSCLQRETASVSKLSFDDNVVTAISNSFREGWNWETITRKFGCLQLNDSTVEKVLLELKAPTDAKPALGFFHWAAKRNGFEHGTRSYCIAIHVLLGARLLTDAKALLESLSIKHIHSTALVDSLVDTSRVVPCSSPLAVNLLIQAYAKTRMTDVAFHVCRYVQERGFSVSVVSFNALLHVVQKSPKCGFVWEVYEYMISRRTYPNAVTLRIMIHALCKEGELQKIVDTLDRIVGKRSEASSPSTIVNCSLILRIFEKGHVEEGGESTVVVLLKRLLQKNLIHESVAYSLIVHAKVTLGSLDSAWELYEEMVRRGFQGNSFIYTSFIGAFCRDGRIEEAIGLMREMEERGLRPYGETFEHVVVGCADSERLEECLSFFEKMLSVGVLPSCLAFNKMVEKLCERGNVEQANSMLTVLLDKGFLPNDVTYSCLMQGYARKDEVEDVLKLYYELEYRSMSPGLSVFATIIQSLCHCGKVEEAEKYLSIMRGRLLTPDATVYKALIAGYMKKSDTARALHFYNAMASLAL